MKAADLNGVFCPEIEAQDNGCDTEVEDVEAEATRAALDNDGGA